MMMESHAKDREERSESLPPEERCSRNDGKQWRCKNRKMPNKALCLDHYQKSRAKAGKSKNGKRGKGRVRGFHSRHMVLNGRDADSDFRKPDKPISDSDASEV